MRIIGFLLFACSLFAKEKVCLNMIVKNESEVIERCLASVKPLIDYWVIFDTGSTDGTQKIIKKFMKDVPGELHESKWVDFAHNRNEALRAAKDKGDYIFFIDADEVLEYGTGFALPKLDKDYYFFKLRQLDAADCIRVAMVKSQLDWKWVGVLHEVLECPQAKTSATLQNVTNICNSGLSDRNKDPERRLKDAGILVKALEKEPNNSRYAYYAGISYAAANRHDLAKQYFEKAIKLDTSETSLYYSHYQLAVCHEQLEEWDQAIDVYFKAHALRPNRAEPLFHAAVVNRKKGNVLLGYLLSKYALTFPRPTDENYVEYMAYDHAIMIEFANCALLLGKFQEGLDACDHLLKNPTLPEAFRSQVVSNQQLARRMLYRE